MHALPRPAKAGPFSVRRAVILGIACVIGAAAGVLTYLASHSIPQALLAAGTATGGSANLLGQITGTGPASAGKGQDDDQHDDQDDSARQQREPRTGGYQPQGGDGAQ